MSRLLYQFPLSLYCEKARWVLDHKGLDYQCVDLWPGMHLPRARWMTGASTLPILKDSGRAFTDSSNIALHLEHNYPDKPLLPSNVVQRRKVLELDAYFDEFGVHARRLAWSHAVDDDNVDRFFFGFDGYSNLARRAGRMSKRLLRRMIRQRFQVYPDRVTASLGCVRAGVTYLETLLRDNPGGYLVGNSFTLADLTAASMLATQVGPYGSPWHEVHGGYPDSPDRRALRESIAGKWLMRIYASYR